ncbi:hypothetical protein [Hymenobacter mucosus]|uniref:Lipoprotein n=1 Tax=Hymenobacter mucosus TaxID=1411120 RepID=A0A238WWB0_9BACT|nr:hypothetical protein [Hymenobacter mucosus]SNR50733.1 hypothetical protein SAMN06269173_103178 [Hymenobacter mucosus]
MRSSWLLVSLLLLGACGPGEDTTVRLNPANRKPGYFDVKGFLNQQVALLNQRKPAVDKQVELRNGQLETTRVAQTDWSKELQIFYQADINKPALRNAYTITPSAYSAGGVQRYARKPGVEGTVESLTINAANGTNQVQELTAIIKQDNALFYSEKKLRLSCTQGQITSYEVTGVQKLVLFDSVRYSVRTRVL